MLYLRTEANLDFEHLEKLRSLIIERTGEDCIILADGMTIGRIDVANDKKKFKWRPFKRINNDSLR